MFVVLLSDACAQPRTVMVHFLYADSTDIAVTRPWGSVYVAGHTKFDAVDFDAIGDDIGDLYMTSDVLVLGDKQQIALHFVSFVLDRGGNTIF